MAVAPPPPVSGSRRIFEKLVTSSSDLEGIVAFGLYKVQEIEWANQVTRRSGGGAPSEADLESFIDTFTDTAVERLRTTARDSLSAFAFGLLQDRLADERQEAVNDSILAEVKRQNGFWWNAFASAVGSVILTIFIFVAGLLWIFDLSPKALIHQLSAPPVVQNPPPDQ